MGLFGPSIRIKLHKKGIMEFYESDFRGSYPTQLRDFTRGGDLDEKVVKANIKYGLHSGRDVAIKEGYPDPGDKKCGYCGGKVSGKIECETYEKIVYKTVPPGARDLRVQTSRELIYKITSGHVECRQCHYKWLEK
jgi:hypothetical protein